MVLQASGTLLFSQIQAEFGGSNPILMSEYYGNAGTGYATGVSGIPTAGTLLRLSAFYGKTKDTYAVKLVAGQNQTLSGSEVLVWTPLGTSGATFEPGSASQRPTYSATGGGSAGTLPYIHFDGTQNDYMINTSGTFNVNCATGGGYTIIVMCKFLNSADNFPRIFTGTGTGSYTEFVKLNGYLQFTLGQISLFLQSSSSTVATQNEWGIYAVRFTNATKTCEMFKDTHTNVIGSTTSASELTTNFSFGNVVFIGKSLNADPYLSMHLNFLLIYGEALSNERLAAILNSTVLQNGLP